MSGKVEYKDVELTGTHTNRRVEYGEGDVLRLRADQAERLIKAGDAKPAANGAKPVNVEEADA